jgi:hypothetical protein
VTGAMAASAAVMTMAAMLIEMAFIFGSFGCCR